MGTRKKYSPEVGGQMMMLRYEIAKHQGWIQDGDKDWWDNLTPAQKSEIQGVITKMMIAKAEMSLQDGTFNR